MRSTSAGIFELFSESQKLELELAEANARIKQFEDCLENAWGIIANVSGGDWSKQHAEWRGATIDWRNNSFHPLWSQVAKRRSLEAKEVA